MRKVKLYTREGQYLKSVLIPKHINGPYEGDPDAIISEQKFYFHRGDTTKYYEGYLILSSKELSNPNTMGIPAEEKGDDSLLEYQPKTLDDASEDYLMFFSKAPDFKPCMEKDEEEFCSWCHHASGQYMRNTYFLWWYPKHGYESWPKSKPPLVQYFNDLGITHADDMSSIILKTAWRKHHGLPVLEHEQVIYYKNFWKEQGYQDGIFVPQR